MIRKRLSALAYWCAVGMIICSVAFSAEEYRLLGVEDLEIATGGTGSAETAVSAGGVTSTKIDSATINMRTSPGGTIDNAITNKQPLDAQLTTLASPTAWRLYYSGATDWAAVAFGDADLCLISGGASAAPTWGECGSGVGSLDNTTMDNTVIGGTTPAAITGTTITGTSGVFTSLTRGTVSNTEFGYLDGVTSAIQTQLNAKQAYDVDLLTLASPTAWRIFYSNGSQAITELALGTSGYFLKSNGASAAPSWVASTVSSLDNTTMDNTVIGGTTPVAGTFTTLTATAPALSGGTITSVNIDNGAIDNVIIGANTATSATFTTIATSTVNSTRFGYLSTLSSNVQSQLDLKRALDNVTFSSAGVATYDNEVVATQFTSTGADNTHFLNVANSGPPSDETLGNCYYDNTSLAWLCWNGSSWAAPSATTIGSGNPTVDDAGEIGIDTTAHQLVYFGSAATTLDPRRTENATFQTPTSGDKAKFRKPHGMTIASIGCVVDASTSVVLDVQECNASGAGCSTVLSAPVTCTTTYGTATVSDATITAGNYVFFSLGTATGTPGYLYVDFNYSVVRE